MKRLLKKLVPAPILGAYHRTLSWAAAVRYGHPSRKLLVVGVTGTNGKSTVCNMVAKVLMEAGHKVGMTTTANFRIGDRDWLNAKKMTMLGRFALQRLLSDMVREGCTHAVIETSSEGIKQFRHADIDYDVAVFTNLTPEHIESHGGFDNYRKAKGKLFSRLMASRHKDAQGETFPKTSVINIGDEHAGYFMGFPAEQKKGFIVEGRDVAAELDPTQKEGGSLEIVRANQVSHTSDGSRFSVDDVEFEISMPGLFNIENALAAIAVADSFGVDRQVAARALRSIEVPGRMERIDEGQPFTVIIDYAPEPESFRKLYEVVDTMPKNRVIHVLGSCGGGRDVSRRPVLGRIAAEKAHTVIVTNEDPYDDDPMEIIEGVATGAREGGKTEGKDLFLEIDRGKAIKMAISEAGEGDIVLITGKGCEQAIAIADGKKLPWDDREAARAALRELNKG
jgi:UDP-N-acetylmuramoyl-L-alanyl-D-glutamate--2,6-diaminopimelate ligase